MSSNKATCVVGFLRFASALFVAATFLTAGRAHAQGLTWVEGRDQLSAQQNIFRADGGDINTALDPNNTAFGQVPGNNLWNWRSEGTASEGFATIYESILEDSPELRVLMTGLTANTSYDVYVAYWSDQTNWGVRSGFASNPNGNPLFNRTGGANATAGVLAGSAAWVTPPDDNPESTDDDPSPFINITTLGGSAAPARQDMYLGFVGTMTSNASGQINVFVDDAPSLADTNQRSWFDGLAYVASGTPVFVTSTLNRDTGNLVINNPTGVTFNIASYSITSSAGSLNSTQWQTIAGGNPTINETQTWIVTAPTSPSASTTELAEAETPAVNGAQLVATTAAFNLGNVWRRTPFQDVQISMTLTNGSTMVLAPTYTGAAIVNGDFNADGVINAQDFVQLRANIFSNTSSLTLAQAYERGDMNQDRAINSTDFLAFRTAYIGANSLAAWNALVAAVPEPSTGLLAAAAAAGVAMVRGRRSVGRSEGVLDARPRFPRRPLIAGLTAAGALLAASTPVLAQSQVIPVMGWHASHNTSDLMIPVTNGNTNSPTIGDGSANSADDTTVWAALANPVTVANGQEIVLTGTVNIMMPAVTGDAFRFGMFDGGNFTGTYDPSIEPLVGRVPASRSTGQPDGWLGFLASASSGGGNGAFDARNPASTQNTQFISNAGGGDVYQLAGLGPAELTWDNDNNPSTPEVPRTQTPNNRVIRLAASPSIGNFAPQEYRFTLTLGRFGFENTMSASLVSIAAAALPGDLQPDQVVDGTDFLVWQRRLGAPQNPTTAAQLQQIRTNFGRTGAGDPLYRWTVSATASPAQDTVPTMITNEVDRIGFLLSNGMNTSQAVFNNVQLELRQIQSLILDVNTNTGAVRARNATTGSFDVVFYEIVSNNGNLNPAGWASLDSTEGNDPVTVGWDVLGSPTANILAEGNLTGSLLVGAGQSFSLGNAFNTATTLGQRDVNFFFATADGVIRRGVVNYNTTSTVSAVPEPASAGITLLCATLLALGRRRESRVTT
jgi:hypothetical protein